MSCTRMRNTQFETQREIMVNVTRGLTVKKSRWKSPKSIRNVLMAVICIGAVTSARAQQGGNTTGTTGANFTNAGASGSVFSKIWVGARASAMAGAYTALADDISALYWNPAGIARLPGINVSATY